MFYKVKVRSKFIQKWFESFSFQFQAKNGTPGTTGYTWSLIGELPPNTSLNPKTGVLCCGPTYWFGPGWLFDVIATDSKGKQDRRSYYFQSSL